MMVRKFEIWLADLNPRTETEIGKVRPVLIVQSDLLNKVHPSTLICPITSQVKIQSKILRVHIPKGTAQ
ncbi:MAG: type II toxin-antitoxin system PemK/MazF family toxin, partial [Bacteroidetes bacterium]|nr:type II toxin-antitoxin system PemK/MazF family toxin [Bacteroidota bacterium]